MLRLTQFVSLVRNEFATYTPHHLRADIIAGVTVAAICLPLALAYGIAGGMTPAAGLVTAIIAGIITGLLGGTAFQISGPTGAMSAVLLVILHRTGLMGMWMATLMGGIFLLVMGLLRFGRYVVFIPTPVITGFTGGIALIIAIGQIDPALGIHTPPADTGLAKLIGYIANHPALNSAALTCTIGTIALIWLLRKWVPRIPDALGAMMLMTIVSVIASWDIQRIGSLPSTIFLTDHLQWALIPWNQFSSMVSAGISIAVLAAIESLMTGTAGAALSGKPFDPDQELLAQGIANLVAPWFGGVPSSAAISRTAVAIRSGASTRLTSIIHAITLLLSVIFLSQVIAFIPLASLAGVLLWTAWHMCDWPTLRRYYHARLKHAIAGLLVTMLATAALDLTQAILIGLAVSAIIHLRLEVEAASVTIVPVDPERLPNARFRTACPGVRVAYVSGALFFGNAAAMRHALQQEQHCHTLIISMRGVPMIDVMGAEVLRQIISEYQQRNGHVMLAGVQPAVRAMLDRLHIDDLIGNTHFYWDAARAIHAIHDEIAIHGCQRCQDECAATTAP